MTALRQLCCDDLTGLRDMCFTVERACGVPVHCPPLEGDRLGKIVLALGRGGVMLHPRSRKASRVADVLPFFCAALEVCSTIRIGLRASLSHWRTMT